MGIENIRTAVINGQRLSISGDLNGYRYSLSAHVRGRNASPASLTRCALDARRWNMKELLLSKPAHLAVADALYSAAESQPHVIEARAKLEAQDAADKAKREAMAAEHENRDRSALACLDRFAADNYPGEEFKAARNALAEFIEAARDHKDCLTAWAWNEIPCERREALKARYNPPAGARPVHEATERFRRAFALVDRVGEP